VNGDSIVVAYDDGNGMFAARLWWMMRWVGHNSSFVLNGGLRRGIELGLPLDTRTPASSDGDFVARPQPGHIAEADEVLAASRDATRRILDARAAERYRGEIETIDAVAGHVPGARNHPFASSVASDGRFRTAEEIRAAIESSLDGVPPARTIAMCGSGVTACHLLLAMEHAGRTGARLYAGSWSEWLRDRARPVATGPEP
jgi:thiosulfate/3-mercaptopyruvate sulfurtransferase